MGWRGRDPCWLAPLGWHVGHVYTDNDLSAYRGRHRPGYAALLAAITSGEADGVLCWHNNRLTRRAREWQDFADAVEHTSPLGAGPPSVAVPTAWCTTPSTPAPVRTAGWSAGHGRAAGRVPRAGRPKVDR